MKIKRKTTLVDTGMGAPTGTYLALEVALRVDSRPDGIRKGQAAFNALYMLQPGLANTISGTVFDPFNDDFRLPRFYAWLITGKMI